MQHNLSSGFSPLASGIGTLNEHSVHAFLKRYYETDSVAHEIKIGRYIADIVGEHGIIEIQTGSFDRLKNKLKAFCEVTSVTVVYPIYVETRKVFPESGRKYTSPKKGSIYDFFSEIYKISDILPNDNITFKLALLEVDEYRTLVGKKKSRVTDRVVTGFTGEITLGGFSDWGIFLPPDLPEIFTSKQFAKLTKTGGIVVWGILKTLTEIGILTCDKSKREFTYSVKL
jgi:hypothetical protein